MDAPPTYTAPPFRPLQGLAHPLAMTVAGALPRRGTRPLQAAEERWEVPVDGRSRLLACLDRPPAGTPRTGVLLLHGLAGSGRSGYLMGTAAKALARGWLAVRMTARNCGGTEHLAPGHYNGADTADLDALARATVAREGLEQLHLVGFSLGANVVLRLAAAWGADAPPWLGALAGVSPCLDYAAAADGLERGFARRWLRDRFLRELRAIVRRRHALDGGGFSLDGLEEARSLRAFDERFTAPLAGFRDADHYYAEASMAGKLDRVRAPALLVAARDDPMVPFTSLRAGAPNEPASLTWLVTARGGHVAFLGRRGGDPDRRWAENRVIEFLVARDASGIRG